MDVTNPSHLNEDNHKVVLQPYAQTAASTVVTVTFSVHNALSDNKLVENHANHPIMSDRRHQQTSLNSMAEKTRNGKACLNSNLEINTERMDIHHQIHGNLSTKMCNTSLCLILLRLRLIAFYIVVALLWAILSLPTLLYFILPSDNTQKVASEENFTQYSQFNLSFCTNCTCRDDFYFNEDTDRCAPTCGSFKTPSPALFTFYRIGITISAFVGVIGGATFLAISCIRWKKVFCFPSVFKVYLMLALLLHDLFGLIASLGQEKLFCSSKDLLESLSNSTSFCVVFGVIRMYASYQAALYWMFHVILSWWKIQRPFHFRDREAFHKYIHLGCVLLALMIPVIPPVAALAVGIRNDKRTDTKQYGYIPSSFPPSNCVPAGSSTLFYTIRLPFNIILIVITPFLVQLFLLIHKHRRTMQQKKNPTKKHQRQKKLLVMFCYYITAVFLGGLFIALSAKSSTRLDDTLNEYFLCESNGTNPDVPCDRSQFERLTVTSTVLTTIARLIISLFPLVSLVYVLDIKDMKKTLKSCSQKVSASSGY